MKLNPETVLKRCPYLRLSINSSDEVQVSVEGRLIKCGLDALSILEMFSAPLTVAAAIRQLGARVTPERRVAAIATLFRLHEGGALRDVSAARDEATRSEATQTTNDSHTLDAIAHAARGGGAGRADRGEAPRGGAPQTTNDSHTLDAIANAASGGGDSGENFASEEIYFKCSL